MIKAYADGALFYAPGLDGYELAALTATVSADKSGTAEITMPPQHPAYNAFVSYRTVVTIHRLGRLVFRGRALYPTDDFYGRRTITCEGERGFLRDSVRRSYNYKNRTAAYIFTRMITYHNEQVDEFKRFRVGEITVDVTVDEFAADAAELISDAVDKLVEACGGYIVFTSDPDGTRVINWLTELSGSSRQVIEFGENLLDYSSTGANTDIATVIVPFGARDKNDKPIGIASVNNGLDYIEDAEAIALRGRIEKPFTWDDITKPSALLERAKAQLAVSKMIVTSLELTAVDMSAMDHDIDTFEPGDWVRVRSKPHGVDDDFLLSSRTYDFLNPSKDKIVFGLDVPTLTGSDVANDKSGLAMLQRTRQSVTAGYTQAIVDAGGSIGDESIASEIRQEMADTYSTKVNTATQYMTHDGLLLQWGTATVTSSAAITYAYPYAEAPTVIVTPATATPADVSVGVDAGSETGVTLITSTTEAVTVYWLAIGKSA